MNPLTLILAADWLQRHLQVLIHENGADAPATAYKLSGLSSQTQIFTATSPQYNEADPYGFNSRYVQFTWSIEERERELDGGDLGTIPETVLVVRHTPGVISDYTLFRGLDGPDTWVVLDYDLANPRQPQIKGMVVQSDAALHTSVTADDWDASHPPKDLKGLI